MIYESIIIGGGPAGITAGIYLARKKVKFLMVAGNIGGQTLWGGEIENYTGYQYISGYELAQKFSEHLKNFDIELHERERADSIKKSECFVVSTDKGEYKSETVIVCTGRRPKQLSVEGEQKFKNKGITYCATCDGPLFADRDVAVLGGGNSGLGVALQMVRIAKKVYLIEKRPNLTADRELVDKLEKEGKAEIFTGTLITKIYGDKFVAGINIKSADGKEKELPVEGVLIEIGSIPNSSLVEGAKKNEWGEIIVNCSTETSIPGLFAAGDVTNVYKKQIIIACGEGAKAAIAASEYLYFRK
jgi:alkyl hydroperoxide reductase subunit F